MKKENEIIKNGRTYKVTYKGGNKNRYFSFVVEYFNEKINQWRTVRNYNMKYELIRKIGGLEEIVY